jgi:SAM-dependent methyltransferase
MTDPPSTEPTFVRATRVAYDTVAVDYAELLRDELAAKPVDRALLTLFAELVRGGGPVADLGCGPGRVTAHLHSLGVDAFGVDLSPAMVDVARRTYPALRFETGSMAALDIADGALSGIVAWYSVIHTPPEQLPGIFAEFHRVLAPGGQLLLAFQTGNGPVHLLDAYRLDPDRVTGQLRTTGLAVHVRAERTPEPPEKVPQTYLLARKADAASTSG